MGNKIVIGVDIGGSHITAGLVDLSTLEVIHGSLIRSKIDSYGDHESIINSWAKVIKQSCQYYLGDEKYLGIAVPGPFDYENGISLMRDQGKYNSLFNINIRALLSKKLEIPASNIRFCNDASCFLTGEVYKQKREKFNSIVGLTIGTGLGSAYFSNGEVYNADLWDKEFLSGIVEDYISSRWFVRKFKKETNKTVRDVKEIIISYHNHNATKQIFLEFSENLSSLVESFSSNRGAELVILGGNITKAYPWFLDSFKEFLKLKLGYEINVELTVLGENAALIGASLLFNRDFMPQTVFN